MRAGALHERVTLQAKSVARDAYGGEVVTWQDQATVWAAVEPINGREYVALRAGQADITLRVRMRYRAGVTPEWRLLWQTRPYDIVDVIDVNARRTELVLMCRGAAEPTP